MKIKFIDYFLFALVYFLEGAMRLTSVALPLFLRNRIGLTIPEVALVVGLSSLPWVIKPLYGWVSDFYPIYGYRRRPYILIGSVIASLGWVLTASIADSFWMVVFAQILAGLGIAGIDSFVDGFAVEKSTKKTKGRIQSVCWGARSVGAAATGLTGGWLLTMFSFEQVFFMTAALPIIVLVAGLYMGEVKTKLKAVPVKESIHFLLTKYKKASQLWWVVLFLFIFFVSPSFGTPFFFYLRESLYFSESLLGLLVSLSSVGGFLGALVYGWYMDRYALKRLLFVLVLVNFVIALVYLFVKSVPIAIAVYLIGGFIGYITLIHCMKLIVGVCPKKIEATTFALVTSVVNLGGSVIAPILGGQLFKVIGLSPLIVFSAFAGLLCLLVLPKIKN